MKRTIPALLPAILHCCRLFAASMLEAEPPIATFSIVAYDPQMEEWGVAVQSKFPAVGSVVPFAQANIGAIASQAWGNTDYGRQGLKLLELGVPVSQVT